MEKEKKKIDFKFNLKIYLSILKNYRFLFISLLVIVLLVESIAVAERYLLKIVIDNGTNFAAGLITSAKFLSLLWIIAAIFLSLLIFKAISKWIELHFINHLDADLIRDLKNKFFQHLVNLSHSFHVSHKTGSMISRLSRGGRAMERMTDTIIFNFAPLFFQIIVVSVSLIFLDKTSAILVLVIALLFLIYNFMFQQMQQNANIKANEAEDFEKGNMGDIFTNVDSIKYFGKEKFIEHKFENITKNTKIAVLNNWNYFRWLDSGQALILGLGTFFLIYFSMIKFLHGDITIGTLVFIYTAYLNLLNPLFAFVRGMRDFYNVMADFDSLFQYAKIKQEVKDKQEAKEIKIKNGEIEFRDVSFSYGKRKIFQDLNLKIAPTKKIALVGHSGCGKTTLIKLLYRLYDLKKGHILIDNQDIKEVKQESLRSEMSIVPQECVLFDDTIFNNIAFSKPGATRSEILQAIRFSQLDKIIATFPNKENTIVGERGIKLSGGEKQRVSIARAILADKKILVLDEATSSLDSETEHEIQKDLQKLMQNRTSIIIAHRLSTIMNADEIIVMKQGKIIQHGRHNKLITQHGEYRKLWNLQKGGYIV